MKKSIFSVLMTAIMMIGCQVNEVNSEMVSSDNAFTTEMETFGDQTKTSMTSDLEVVWSKGDQLTIFRGSYLGNRYQIDDQFVGKPYGDFKLVGEGSSGNDFSSGTELPANVAIYPYKEGLTLSKNVDGGNVSCTIEGVEFPSEQEYSENSFGEESFIMAAVTESLSDHKLKFKNVGGALKLQLKGTGTIKTVSIQGNNGESLSGTADVTVSTASTPVYEFTSASKVVTLDCGTNGVSLKSSVATNFIISLPAVNFTKGFTVTITDINGKTEELKTTAANNIARSAIHKMPEKTVVFEDEDSGVPQMYYGYIPYDILIKYDWKISQGTSVFTEDWIQESIDKGTMIKTDLEKLGEVKFDVIPDKSFVFFALPSSCGLEVTQTKVLNEGGKFSLDGSIQGNGEDKMKIGGKSYDCYGTYERYAQNNYICHIDIPKEPQLFYGYISPEMMAKYNLSSTSSYDQITAECINACLDKGTLIRNDVDTMSETSFGDVPANSLLVVGVAEKSIYAAFKWTSSAEKNEFDGLSSTNGDCTTSWYGENYLLYGEYTSAALSKDNSAIRFQIDYRPNTEGKLPMYIGYIPYETLEANNMATADCYSKITQEILELGVSKGEILKTDAKTIEYDGEGFGNVPAKSLLIIALPQSSGLKATSWSIFGENPFSVKPLSNGENTISIDGNTYRLYGEFTLYSLIKDSEEIYYKIKKDPSQPQTLPMYYGYIPYDSSIPDSTWASEGFKLITEQRVIDGVSNGNVATLDAGPMGKTSFGNTPVKSFVFIAVPSSSGLVATQDSGIGSKIEFNTNPSANGDVNLTINNIQYDLYGQIDPIGYTNNKFFYID